MSGVPAVLALADGTIFRGQSIGAKGNTTGEVVFNTAITGYQEILTDPSYARQIVTLTTPHIGNTGATPEDLMRTEIPSLIVPGHDASHATSAARYLEECLPRSDYWDVAVDAQTEDATNARVLEFLGKAAA